jgi:hypothetical protein
MSAIAQLFRSLLAEYRVRSGGFVQGARVAGRLYGLSLAAIYTQRTCCVHGAFSLQAVTQQFSAVFVTSDCNVVARITMK